MPETVAFHVPLRVVPLAYFQLTVQPLMVLVPLLVMRMAPVKPAPQLLEMT